MIAKLQGVIDCIKDDWLIVNVNSVGYKVYSPDINNIKLGDNTTLWIETIVREDSIKLFGFLEYESQELFNKLLSVSGLGPKGSMSVLTTLNVTDIIYAINSQDYKTLTSAPGVGKKMAEKIIYELKSKIQNIEFKDNSNQLLSELLSALEVLGYRRNSIFEKAKNVVNNNRNSKIEQLIPIVLKEINDK